MRLFYTELWGSGNVSVLGAERLLKFQHQYAMKIRNESASKNKLFATAPRPASAVSSSDQPLSQSTFRPGPWSIQEQKKVWMSCAYVLDTANKTQVLQADAKSGCKQIQTRLSKAKADCAAGRGR
jgi:hypothetical protein